MANNLSRFFIFLKGTIATPLKENLPPPFSILSVFFLIKGGALQICQLSFLKRPHFMIYKAMWVSAVIKNECNGTKRLKKQKWFQASEFRGRVGPDLQLSLKIPAQLDGWEPYQQATTERKNIVAMLFCYCLRLKLLLCFSFHPLSC